MDLTSQKANHSIRMSGVVQKLSYSKIFQGSISIFKKRTALIHPTLLTFTKHAHDLQINEIEKLNNQSEKLEEKYNFLLAPMGNESMMAVTQVGELFLTLSLHNTKARTANGHDIRTLTTVANDMTNGSTSRLRREITLKFANSDDRNEWMSHIVAECRTNYLDGYFTEDSLIYNKVTADFVTTLHSEIWGRIVLSTEDFDPLRKILILRPKTHKHTNVQNTMNRCIDWLLNLLNIPYLTKDHAEMFITIFFPAITNYLFRAILFLIEPDPYFIQQFLIKYPIQSIEKAVQHCIKKIAFDVSLFKPEHYFFLHILRHPFAPIHDPIKHTFKIKEPLFDLTNRDEIDWQVNCISQLFSWDMVDDILNGAAAFTFHLLMGYVKDIVDDSTVANVLEYLAFAPPRYFETDFHSVYTIYPLGKHFDSLLNYCRYREMWKIFCQGHLNVELHPEYKEFIDAVHRLLWGKIVDGRCKALTEMFNSKAIHSHVMNYEFIDILHGELINRLIRKDLVATKAFSVGSFTINGKSKLNEILTQIKPEMDQYDKLIHSFNIGLRSLISRLIQWIENISDQSMLTERHAHLFVELLVASVDNNCFRAFVMLFLPTNNVIGSFLSRSTRSPASDSNNNNIEQPAELIHNLVQKVFDLKTPQFRSFLAAADYTNNEMVRNGVGVDGSCKWSKETEWFIKIEQNFHSNGQWYLEWEQLTLALTDTPAAAFMVVMNRYKKGNPLDSIEICAKLEHYIIWSSFSSSFTYESLLSEIPVINPTRIAMHFISFINFCRIRCMWSILESQRLLTIEGIAVKVQRELWDAVELIRGKSIANLGLIQLCSTLTDKHNANDFASVIPLVLSKRTAANEEPLRSIFNMLLTPSNIHNDPKYQVLNDIHHLHHFKTFTDHIYDWAVMFVGESPDVLPWIYVQLLGTCMVSPLVRALLVICFPFRKIGLTTASSTSTVPLYKVFCDSLEKILRKDNISDLMEQALLFCFNWCKHPLVDAIGNEKFCMKRHDWDKELLWISEWKSKPWRFDVREFQSLIDIPYFFPFKIISRDFKVLDNVIIQRVIREYSSIPSELRKHPFKCHIDYLPYDICRDSEPQNILHFNGLINFSLFREIWRMFRSNILDPEAGNAAFAREVISLLWLHISTNDNSKLRMFFFPKASDTIAMKSTFLSVLQRQCMYRAKDNETLQLLCEALTLRINEVQLEPGEDLSCLDLYINQICEWTAACVGGKTRLEASDAEVFVELLFASVNDVAFRVFVARFVPDENAAAGFATTNEYQQNYPNVSAPLAMIRCISKGLREPRWHNYRRFMDTLKHPTKKAGCLEEEEPNWCAEANWLADALVQRDIVFTAKHLSLFFEQSPYLIWMIASEAHDVEQTMALKTVSPIDLNAKFSVVVSKVDREGQSTQELLTEHHFIAMCLDDDGIAFSIFLEKKQTTDEFFEVLTRLALTNDISPKIRRLANVSRDIVFLEGDSAKGFNANLLSTIPRFASILIEEIYRAVNRTTFRRDVLTLCEIMALLLRLEGIRGQSRHSLVAAVMPDREMINSSMMSNVTTLSEYMTREPDFQRKVLDIVREINFVKWFARKCDRIKAFFGPHRDREDILALQQEQEQLLQYHQQRMNALLAARAGAPVAMYGDLPPLLAVLTSPRKEIEILIFAFLQIFLEFQPQLMRDFVTNLGTGRPFFLSFFHHSDPFRRVCLSAMLRLLRITSNTTLISYLEQGYLLYDNDHFAPTVMECIAMPGRGRRTGSCNMNEQQFSELMVVALYLHDIDNLKHRVEKLLDWLLQDDDRLRMTEKFLRWMIDQYIKPDLIAQYSMQRIRWKNCQHFATLSLEDFLDCANQATIATQLLRGSEATGGYKSLENLFLFYFTKGKPSLWKSMFSQSKTIAYFIKYVDREDLEIAFAKFKEINITNKRYLFHLYHVKQILSRPVVSAEELMQLTTNQARNGRDNVEKFLDQLLQSAIQLPSSQFDLKVIMRLTAFWMKVSLAKIQIPLPPRNAQLITLQCCASWAKNLILGNDQTQGKALIAQVGTGEGKSLIIAMMAIYFVKILRKRVHILENNLGLLEEDFDQLQPLFKEFNILPRNGKRSSFEAPDLTKLHWKH